MLPGRDEGRAHGDQAEAESDESEPYPGTESAYGDCAGQLEGYASDCEDEDADAVAVACEVQICEHRSD